MNLASIPSPSQSVWHLGPFPLRAYALCIILGVIAAVVLSERRLRARGGPAGAVVDIAVYAVPLGIVGARIYHIITTPEPYFGDGGHPLDMFYIWKGGLGIWGAVAGGAVGAWLGCRKFGIPLRMFADVVAPGLVLAQAIGRFGNWFNQELFGKPTNLPWGLRIDPAFRPTESLDSATFHPTFLYESLWCIGVAVVLLFAEKRFKLGHGRLFALYGLLYVLGRVWIEYLRVDTANHILGLRLNIWTCVIVGAVAVWYLATHRGGQEMLAMREDGTVMVVGEDTPANEVITNEVITNDLIDHDAAEAIDEPAPDPVTDEVEPDAHKAGADEPEPAVKAEPVVKAEPAVTAAKAEKAAAPDAP